MSDRTEDQRSEQAQLDEFRAAGRIQNSMTMVSFPLTPEQCSHPNERTVVCATDSAGRERDVVECSRCGRQRETGCNFDEDYS